MVPAEDACWLKTLGSLVGKSQRAHSVESITPSKLRSALSRLRSRKDIVPLLSTSWSAKE